MAELGLEMSKSELTEPARHKEKLRKVYMFLVRLDQSLCVSIARSLSEHSNSGVFDSLLCL